MWKLNLHTLVQKGKFEAPVTEVKDNECEFGKWFYGPTITAKHKTSPHYKQVKQLHLEFHDVAARVVNLATEGNKEEAERLMSFDGEFTVISNKLIEALVKWKENFIR